MIWYTVGNHSFCCYKYIQRGSECIIESLWNPVLRTFFTFIVVMAITRILGRKQLSQLTFFDYVAGTTIGALAASSMSNVSIPLLTDVICFLTWGALIIAVNITALHSIPVRKLLKDEPRLVIRDGKILESNLKNGFYSINDLLAQLREKDVFDPNEIETGIIETNGQLSILKKGSLKPVLTQDLNSINKTDKNISSQCYGKELVLHGQIIFDNLSSTGVTEDWIKQQLGIQGISDLTEVTLAVLTPQGTLYIDKKSDQ